MKITKKDLLAIVITISLVSVLNGCQNSNKSKDQTTTDKETSSITTKSVDEGTSCNTPKLEYTLTDEGGVMVEKFDSKITDENRYNQNNKVYIPKTKIRYSYKYVDTDAKEYLFKATDIDEDGLWDLNDISKTDNKTVSSILITVLNGLDSFKNIPDYNQTIIQYDFLKNDGTLAHQRYKTGVIENEANIWMHPARTKNFRALELNPFPFIKKPYAIGNKWSWKMSIGDFWSNKNWKEWKGSIKNNYEYEIIDKVNLETKQGLIECYKIKSTATSRIGKTTLMAYFSEKYGFVKLDYTNINNTKIVFDMVEFIKYDTVLDSNRYNL